LGDPYKTDEDWAIPSKGSATRGNLNSSSLGGLAMGLIAIVLLSLTFNGYLLLKQNDFAERAYITDASRQQEVADMLTRLDAASDRIEELQAENIELERKLGATTVDAEGQSDLLEQARARINDLNAQIAVLEGERDDLATSIAEISESGSAIQAALDEEIRESSDLRLQLDQAEEKSTALLERINLLETQTARLSSYPSVSEGTGFVFFAFITEIDPQIDEELESILSNLTLRSFDFTYSRVPPVVFDQDKGVYEVSIEPDVYGAAIFRGVPSINTSPSSVPTESYGVVDFYRIRPREKLSSWKLDNSEGVVEPEQQLFVQRIIIVGDQLWLKVCLEQTCASISE